MTKKPFKIHEFYDDKKRKRVVFRSRVVDLDKLERDFKEIKRLINDL